MTMMKKNNILTKDIGDKLTTWMILFKMRLKKIGSKKVEE